MVGALYQMHSRNRIRLILRMAFYKQKKPSDVQPSRTALMRSFEKEGAQLLQGSSVEASVGAAFHQAMMTARFPAKQLSRKFAAVSEKVFLRA